MIFNQSIFKLSTLLFILAMVLPTISFSQTTIWEEDFSSYADGTNVGAGNRWAVTTTNGIDYFEVRSQEFLAKDTGANEQIFTTEIINISSYSNVSLSVEASKFNGMMELNEDYVKVYYKLDGGTEIAFGTNGINLGEFGNITASQTGLYGSTIQIIIRVLNGTGDYEVYSFDNIKVKGTIANGPEINVLGNDITITSGTTAVSTTNGTDLGSVNLASNSIAQTFTIENLGSSDVLLVDTPYVSITGADAADFSVDVSSTTTPISSGNSTTFQVTFSPLSLGVKTATIHIESNDVDEGEYTFNIEGVGAQNFFDSDGDGIFDHVDIDDDNDGVLDALEESACKKSSISIPANYKFLNETFGTLAPGSRTTINTSYNATTTYCYEEGTGSGSSCGDTWILDDGEYVVVSKITGTVDSDPDNIHGDTAWTNVLDHTADDGDTGGMAVFNAAWEPGVFYETTITGILPNVPITYSFWVLNIMSESKFSGSILPNVTVQFVDLFGNVITSIDTGEFGRCASGVNDNSCSENEWQNFTRDDIVLGDVDKFIVKFINNAPGGSGNDLALDDIVISQTLCDTDSDGVADVFDLDSDNDGIPDVVESGLGIISLGTAKIPYPSGWVDANGNGMHDAAESNVALDSDGDGVPNYLDLDSDNDSIFDVDESGAGNTANTTFQNGDGDISGNGVGQGTDTDYVRETDYESDGISEYFTDGILDIYDFYNGVTFDTAYGNVNQGEGNTYYVLDTDSDGIPNYMDITSDGTNFDIASTLYANLDTDTDGIIDDTNDSEGDGIVDLFDTDDSEFGSPRDINDKLLLYFDGRNDYVEDAAILSGEASIMGWIKIESAPIGTQRILGQNHFYIQINSSKKIAVVANSTTQEYDTAIDVDRWVHIAATYSSSDFKLYINGVELGNGISGGTLSTDTSSFTMGRISDTDSGYFKGYIDEVRVFNKALTENELHKIVYQEIEENSGVVKGSVVQLNVQDYNYDSASSVETSVDLSWSNLIRYYRMDTYKDDITDDLSTAAIDVVTGAKMYNMKVIDVQTAPLPFITQSEGTILSPKNLTEALNTSNGVYGEDAITSPASIVKIEHNNIYSDEGQNHVALFLSSGMLYTMNGAIDIDNGIGTGEELAVSWYLDLNGTIDLNGESQLVQGMESILATSSSGSIERDQEGTANVYSYNYWGSPVGVINNTSNNSPYTLGDVLYHETSKVDFVGGYDGNDTTTPIQIANYWLFKYANLTGTYAEWQHVGSTGDINAGEGFTMKGGGEGLIDTFQDYTFKGKPNNGTIALGVSAKNLYLVANPYPSAIDAYKFISENGEDTLLTGTLYFWEQYRGTSHVLAQYEGGYGAMTQGGAVAAVIPAGISSSTDASQSLKIPKQYIPVAQGFFVQSVDKTGVEIKFKNSQRIFVKESETASGQPISVFMKTSIAKATSTTKTDSKGDVRPKIRLGFEAPNVSHRQLLLTIDEKATDSVDWGYDGKVLGVLDDDMYWSISNEKYVIQVIPNIATNKEIPLGITMKESGAVLIQIDTLENVASNLKLYIKDNLTGSSYQINNEPFKITLDAGTYLDRFSLTFKNAKKYNDEGVSLIEDVVDNVNLSNKGLYVFINNRSSEIIIKNRLQKTIKHVVLYNCLGQVEERWTKGLDGTQVNLPVAKRLRGMYLIRIKTTSGVVFKKVIIK